MQLRRDNLRGMQRPRPFAIPKEIHVVWIGDDARKPNEWIETWKQKNPLYRVTVWGNQELHGRPWKTYSHMCSLLATQIYGVADLMRWEILSEFGGFTVDADTICVSGLDDWLFELEAFACWENELARPGLISNAYVASGPRNTFFANLIADILRDESVLSRPAWQTVGPLRFTTSYHKHQYSNLTILPSHFFMPSHFSGVEYTGSGITYGRQQWASTKSIINASAASEVHHAFNGHGDDLESLASYSRKHAELAEEICVTERGRRR